ncbi:hypothetical protein KY290_021539 [Solanum tuberosum]|uniref:Reverse transcriptase domain-containing protein n=1 Tax=Solanum tuberosum TaxID=4113 RepID=A0ABQ7V3W1_SOLTU|nr:hypothetical protein KY290_021539 [Solanum tuberosum]
MWSRQTYGDIFQQLIIREEIARIKEELFEEFPSTENREVMRRAKAEYTKYLHLEESYWQQKAGYDWLVDGDRYTRFFHSLVKGRRQRLKLLKIQNSKGDWLEDSTEIAEEAVQFFQKQFMQERDSTDHSLLAHVPALINEEENATLGAIPNSEEVKNAVFKLNGDSAGGPVCFLENFINHVGTLLVQTADIVRTELISYISKRGKPSNVVIKLDMAKAYDRVSCFFLMKILRKMGFSNKVVDLIWRLITNNYYSVIINGQPHGFFHSTRGVKQGDPLFPALFILSAEVLTRALNALFNNDQFIRYGMPKWSPNL